MARQLKVYGITLRGTHRGIVAATSRAEAARIMKIQGSHVKEFAETGNKLECNLALGEPRTVFISKHFGSDYTRVEPGMSWNAVILAQARHDQ